MCHYISSGTCCLFYILLSPFTIFSFLFNSRQILCNVIIIIMTAEFQVGRSLRDFSSVKWEVLGGQRQQCFFFTSQGQLKRGGERGRNTAKCRRLEPNPVWHSRDPDHMDRPRAPPGEPEDTYLKMLLS